MTWVLRIVGAIAVLMGTVWMLQGIGRLPGSFMTGQMTWFWIGLLLAAIGFGLIAWGSRRTRRR